MSQGRLTRRTLIRLTLAGASLPLSGHAFAQDDRPVIAVANYPLAYFAERLVGDLAEVLFPVPPGTDPSFWRPSIADISAMQAAQVIALNGAGFSDWTTKVSLPRARIIDTSAGFADAYIATETITHSHGEAGTHSHTGTASYTWLDFGLAARQADALAARLIRAMPQSEATILTNLLALNADLAALDAAAKALRAPLAAIASHPRYQYFGRAYGLEIAAMEWDAQEEVSEDQWQALEQKSSESGATLFIWEATPSDDARARIATLGLTDVVFPPLAQAPVSGDFISEMTKSIAMIAQSLDA
ncbi:MAG: zinc ABC transporter substrate-binding protein [Pseudomonadota bacterium]